MKRYTILLLVAIFGMMLDGFAQTKRVAVMPLVDRHVEFPEDHLSRMRNLVKETVMSLDGCIGDEPDNLATVMDERKFQRTGAISSDEIKEIGATTGCTHILVIITTKFDEKNVGYYGRLIDVNTTRTVSSRTVGGKNNIDGYVEAMRTLVDGLLAPKQGSQSAALSQQPAPKHGSDMPAITRPVSRGNSTQVTETAFGLNMRLIWVDGGTFMMGCTAEQGSECKPSERNAHRVTLDGYYIGMLEVTQGQWEKVMGTNVYQQRNKRDPKLGLAGVGTDNPMYYVSWDEAMEFCRRLSQQTGKKYTLPTEAQWEFAARGGNQSDGTKYSGSKSLDEVAWYGLNSGGATHVCGSKHPNELGIYDMSGNVWEWCLDWYADDYVKYDVANPQGPATGSNKVNRGGSWFNEAKICRVSNRDANVTTGRGSRLGFRVVLIP